MPPWGLFLGPFTLVEELQLGQMSFGPLPSLPNNPSQRLHWGSSLKCWSEEHLTDIRCCKYSAFYTVLPQKTLYRQSTICRQTHRPTHASQMLVNPVSASRPKFWYFHGSWFLVVLVPHLSGVAQCGLPWGVLSTMLGVTIPDDPAFPSALSTGGAGVTGVVFSTLAMGLSILSCSRLELMGSR